MVEEICPKVGPPNAMSGSLNWAWLKALKNSVRNSRPKTSLFEENLNFLSSAMSQLFWPGPVMMPTLEFPKPSAVGSSALNTAGVVKQDVLI